MMSRVPSSSLFHLVECLLQTIEYYSTLSRPAKRQLHRHVLIAQEGIDLLNNHDVKRITKSYPSVYAIVNMYNSDVRAWTNKVGDRSE